MGIQTRQCSIEELPSNFAAEIRRYILKEDEVLSCSETRKEDHAITKLLNAWSGFTEEYHFAQVITPNLIIRVGHDTRRGDKTTSMRLLDIINVEEWGDSSEYRVIIHGHGDTRIDCYFATSVSAKEFSLTLHQAIERAKIPPPTISLQSPVTVQERLQVLTQLFKDGLINEIEFQQKRNEILSQL